MEYSEANLITILEQIKNSALSSRDKREHGMFNQRQAKTQEFYNWLTKKINSILIDYDNKKMNCSY